MAVNVIIGGQVQPRITFLDDSAQVEIQPHAVHVIWNVETAEAMRDAYQAVVDGFAARAMDWAAKEEVSDRAASELSEAV